MHIRHATIQDVSCLSVLSIEVWLHTYARNGIPKPWADYVLDFFSTKSITGWMEDTKDHVWLVEAADGSGVQGYLRLSETGKQHQGQDLGWEISTLYVRNHHKGQGIGYGLLQAATDFAKQKSLPGLFLNVNDENASAIAFYERQKFQFLEEAWFTLDEQNYRNLLLHLPLAVTA